MPYHWPADTEFRELELHVLERDCPHCGRMTHVCDHRRRRFHSFDGPVELTCRLVHCPDHNCPGHARTKSPEGEMALAPPIWAIDWEVFCWIGQRRFARHWSCTQIRDELRDAHGIRISDDSVARYLQHYQRMLAARQEDPETLRREYEGIAELALTIDGLQPEKGHETLYVVRELNARRVWFGEALISATADEVRRLLAQAKRWAAALGKPVALWVSDKQQAFVSGIAAEFPGVPHRYCDNHFLRDAAKPVLEADSRAKVRMRAKVRGLRAIEKAVLQTRKAAAAAAVNANSAEPAAAAQDNTNSAEPAAAAERNNNSAEPAAAAERNNNSAEPAAAAEVTNNSAEPAAEVNHPVPAAPSAESDPAGALVLDYCAAVRGIVNDDQGGPLAPPGLRMAAALTDVQASLQRNLAEKKGGSSTPNSRGWTPASRAASSPSGPNRRNSAAKSRT